MYRLVLLVLIALMLLGDSVSGRKRKNRPKYGEQQEVEDQEHIKEHLKEDQVNVENMTERQRHFHYFRMYDYDKNFKIDGLEIIQAITHNDDGEDDEEEPEEPEEGGKIKRMPDSELESAVDEILSRADVNMDGYIVFHEYIKYLIPKTPDPPPPAPAS